MVPPTTSLFTAMPQGEPGGGGRGAACCGQAGPAGHCCPRRVWLYVDDQFQNMKAHQGPRPRSQPQPETLLLGGLPEPDTLRNLSGCVSNVFVQR